MILKQFIEAGWHTVPLKGELRRNADGKKTIPLFEGNWRTKYSEQFNERVCGLAGAITGKKSGIIAIDCDNQATYDMFKSLDPEYDFHFISKGKPEGGGTIIYKYVDMESFSLNDNNVALDFYADNGFVYLPTEDNYTKEHWIAGHMPEIKELPKTIETVLKSFAIKRPQKSEETQKTRSVTISNRLAPMLEDMMKKAKYSPAVFKILTPRDFRDLPQYVKQGHLHPKDVPNGRGSEYLSKVSAILGSDVSVSMELYLKVMSFINSLWDSPMEQNKLQATVLNPMTEGKATIDGQPIWQYDRHWEDMGFIATTTKGDYVESFYDDIKNTYYIINYTAPYVKTFTEKRQVITTLKSLTGRGISELQYDSSKQILRSMLNPAKEFGRVVGEDEFNLFRQTEELMVLNNPSAYMTDYKKPETLLKYLETLVPDKEMRNYLLSFIRTKLTTFEYSPVVIYMIGAHGSGKDTLLGILGKIIGAEYVTKPDTKVFLEQYNGWLMDKYFIQLDEYGNKLTRHNDKQEALGKIKSYSGSPNIQIRAMRQDGFNYKHCMTMFITANSNPLPLETEDRRIAYVKTPNRLDTMDWVKDAGGISLVHGRIMDEIMDFCYYLATEVENLKGDNYVVAPSTEDKAQLILSSLPMSGQIGYMLQRQMFEDLESMFIEYGVSDYTRGWDVNRIDHDKLVELYEIATDNQGTAQALGKALKQVNFVKQRTTRNGDNSFYYYVEGLKSYQPKSEVGPIEAGNPEIRGV